MESELLAQAEFVESTVLRLVIGASLVLLVLISALLVVTLILRLAYWRTLVWDQRAERAWLPRMMQIVVGDTPSERQPALPKAMVPGFCRLWCSLLDIVAGQSAERLKRLGKELDLYRRVQPLLDHRQFDHRLLAVTVLGHIGSHKAAGVLQEIIARDNSPVLALAALQGLNAIDPVHGLYWVLEGRKRHYWPVERLVGILRDTEPESMHRRLWHLVQRSENPADIAVLLQLVDALQFHPSARDLKDVADRFGGDPQVLQSLLPLVNHDALHYWVTQLLRHPDHGVRVQAITALGRVGKLSDRHDLMGLLTDKDWWVRYRATQSLLNLPQVNEQDVVGMVSNLGDAFAHDMVRQVLKEREWEERYA